MTLFQRDRENRELGREEGREEGYESSTKILKLYNKGIDKKEISSELNLDLALVEKIIRNYESIQMVSVLPIYITKASVVFYHKK